MTPRAKQVKKKLGNGAALQFFCKHVVQNTHLCIDWPYAKAGGYGRLVVDGRNWQVNRLALTTMEGEPPSKLHYALHSCNNPACFNYRHLRWGTQAENILQAQQEGRRAHGERNGQAILTDRQVQAIRNRHAKKGETHAVLAKLYGMSRRHITQLISPKRRKK